MTFQTLKNQPAVQSRSKLARSFTQPAHTVKYAGVLASASPWRPRVAPPRKPPPPAAETHDAELSPKHASRHRAWAELLKRTFDIDVLECPKCHGRMKLLAMITDGKSVERYLTKLGEPTDALARSPSRGPRWDEVALSGTTSWMAYFVVARSVLLFNDRDTREAQSIALTPAAIECVRLQTKSRGALPGLGAGRPQTRPEPCTQERS